MFTLTTASPHPVSHVLFHPDGFTFAVTQPNSGFTLVDRMTGSVVGTVPVPRVAEYSSIIFAENGARLVAASARGVTVCDTATGEILVQRGKATLAGAVLAERAGGLIAATPSGLRTLSLGTVLGVGGHIYPVLTERTHSLQSSAALVAVSPGGRWAVGVYERVKPSLIDIGTRRVVLALDHPYRTEGSRFGSPGVTFATTGDRFAICDGINVTVFDTPNNSPEPDAEPDDEPGPSLVQRAATATAPKPRAIVEPVFTLNRPSGVAATDLWRPPLAFTPDGRGLLVRRPRNRVQLWDVATGTQLGEWSWRLDSVTCLAIAPDGLTAVAGARHGRVVVWDLE
ncbi:WD40 repeat domain-containing protein [Gemmata sp.]|uniref:WD40 repeat domain-containing protein n=1 Tax=Gemmata sp. TaxID=1914242 RepID=UPI003F710007